MDAPQLCPVRVKQPREVLGKYYEGRELNGE
jgi:hypothetical protein